MWQPIETAPKDGTRIDLWVKSWRAHDDGFNTARAVNCYWSKGDSISNYPAHWVNLESGWRPTHWMFIPGPPEGDKMT